MWKMKKNIKVSYFLVCCILHITKFVSVQSDSPYLPLRYHLSWWGERRQPQFFGRSMGWTGNFHTNSIQTVQDWERCKGFSEEESEGVECFLTLGGKVSCTNWVEVNKELRFRCSSGFIAKNSRDRDTNPWHCSICLGNGKWSNHEIRTFSCEINYGYFEELKRFSPLILNGTVTDSKSVPWNAAIFIGRNFYCGATLISTSFILTASHCLFSPDDPPILFALSHFRIVFATTSGDYEEAIRQENVQLHDVVEMYVHPEYTDYPKYHNDIAILKLKKKVKISKHVLPVLLPTETHAREIESRSWLMRVNGLGISSKEDSDQPTRKLYGVEVTTKSSNCRTFEPFEDKQICLSPIDTASGICHGDSGGGAFIEYPPNSRRFFIQGLVSVGNEFTKRLSDHCFTTVIFTKVYSYMFWIQSIISPQRFITSTTTTTTTTTTAAPVRTTQSTTTPSTSTSTRKPTTIGRKIVQTTTRPPSTTSLPPPRSSSASPPYSYSSEWCANSWRTLGVEIHNELRRRHGITPLRLDCKLSQEAQEYANFAVNFIAQPKYGIIWGQNIYSSKGSALFPDDAVRRAIERWYTGIYEYNWQFPLSSPGYGHSFSQVLWKSSETVGFGIASTVDHTLVVAFYSPAGNDPTSNQRYQENVYPLLQRTN